MTGIVEDPRINACLDILWNGLTEAPSLKEAADLTGLSPCYFHRLFHAATGETYRTHIQRLRIERGAMWLKFGGVRSMDAALGCGFASREGFVRAFVRHFGETPAAWRDSVRNVLAHAPPDTPKELLMPVRYETIPSLRLAYCRHIGPYAGTLKAWRKLHSWAVCNGLPADAMRVGISYDDPWFTHEPVLRYDACIRCDDLTPDHPAIAIQTMPGGLCASFSFQGHYWREGPVWDWICHNWLPSSNQQLRDLRFMSAYHVRLDNELPGLVRLLLKPINAELLVPVATHADYECPPIHL